MKDIYEDRLKKIVKDAANPIGKALGIARMMYIEIGVDWPQFEDFKSLVESTLLKLTGIPTSRGPGHLIMIGNFDIEDDGSHSWGCLVGILSIFEKLNLGISEREMAEFACRTFLDIHFSRLANDGGFISRLDAEVEIYRSDEWEIILDLLRSL